MAKALLTTMLLVCAHAAAQAVCMPSSTSLASFAAVVASSSSSRFTTPIPAVRAMAEVCSLVFFSSVAAFAARQVQRGEQPDGGAEDSAAMASSHIGADKGQSRVKR